MSISIDHIAEMKRFLIQSKKHCGMGDLEEAMNQLRKFCEALIEEFAMQFEIDKTDKNWYHKTLSTLGKNLKTKNQTLLKYYLDHLQNLGNFGSHYQVDPIKLFDEDVEYCIFMAQRIFQEWVNEGGKHHLEITIIDIVHCPHCKQKKGFPCVGNRGKPVNNEHRARVDLFNEIRGI